MPLTADIVQLANSYLWTQLKQVTTAQTREVLAVHRSFVRLARAWDVSTSCTLKLSVTIKIRCALHPLCSLPVQKALATGLLLLGVVFPSGFRGSDNIAPSAVFESVLKVPCCPLFGTRTLINDRNVTSFDPESISHCISGLTEFHDPSTSG